ncbi:MAG TPA: Bax inhibitor-1/YccA family protein, partial [Candidatus Acidoferrales bacterium]|nr:Bax inhibitor-1/YccA family protein [Candidatus Acidoferrales bacterium]
APVSAEATSSFLTHAFVWMFAGLLLIIGILVLPMVISFGLNRIGATAALGLFFVYAAGLGLLMGLIVQGYGSTSVVSAFLTSSGMFGGAALYGYTTKRSLASLGGILTMALIGLLVAMIVNIFLASTTVSWVLSLAGVVLFTVLTAYDVQRIAVGSLVAMTGSIEKAAVLGALRLYLDFVNLFLFMLRLFGGRR